MEGWAAQGYVADTGEKTLQCNAKALGGLDALRQIEDLIEAMGDEE